MRWWVGLFHRCPLFSLKEFLVKMPYYAVRHGRNTGIYNTWGDCESQVKGFRGSRYKKFGTAEAAQEFVNGSDRQTTYSSNGGESYSQGSSTGSYTYCAPKRSATGGTYTAKRFKSDSACGDPIEVYTDGACTGNGKASACAGIGVYWGPGHNMNVSEKLEGRPTNNRAEIQAACKALSQAKEMGRNNIVVNTDSQFMISSMTNWIHKWKQNDWTLTTGKPVVNKEDFVELDRLQQGMSVTWKHVPGHSGVHGNEAADRLAVEGTKK